MEKTENPAPHTHDLLNLASIAEIDLSEEQKNVFREINTFNIALATMIIRQEFYKKPQKSMQKNILTKQINYIYG